jgi:hypothetical protein
MVQVFEGLQIQAMAPVDDNMVVLDKSELWGFTLILGDDATFVFAGTKKKMKSHLDDSGSLLGLAYEAIRSSENVLANELLDLTLDDELGVVINGEYFEARDVRKAVGVPED